jgi:hypothetical protein
MYLILSRRTQLNVSVSDCLPLVGSFIASVAVGSNPVHCTDFIIHLSLAGFHTPGHTVPGTHPAFCTVGTGSLPGVIWPGCVNHPSPSSVEVAEIIALYLSLCCGPVVGRTLPSPFRFIHFSSSSSSSSVIFVSSSLHKVISSTLLISFLISIKLAQISAPAVELLLLLFFFYSSNCGYPVFCRGAIV